MIGLCFINIFKTEQCLHCPISTPPPPLKLYLQYPQNNIHFMKISKGKKLNCCELPGQIKNNGNVQLEISPYTGKIYFKACQRLLVLNAVTAQVRLMNKSHKTISRIFCVFDPGDYVQLAWRIFCRPLHMPPSACFSSCGMQAGLMSPRPRGRWPPTPLGGRQMGHLSDDLRGGRHDELMLARLLLVRSYILSKEGSILR